MTDQKEETTPATEVGSYIGLSFGIAEATRLVGVSAATLRAWEREGFVTSSRNRAGYRRFTHADIAVLRRVRHLRQVEKLNLPAIRRILELELPTIAAKSRPGLHDSSWAARLRRLREEQELSLREVGRLTGLSPSYISAVERELANPSIAALQKLTAAYQTSIAVLMNAPPQPDQTLVRRSDRQVTHVAPGVRLEQLNFGLHAMELHLFTVNPGAGSGEFYRHDGEEFILVMKGKLEVWLDDIERYFLGPGDVLYFESTRPHQWSNPGNRRAVFLGVNTPATF